MAEARTVEEAQAFIKRVKAELSDASSHACAYHVGFGASVTDGCSDGGEPSGTAGKMAVINPAAASAPDVECS